MICSDHMLTVRRHHSVPRAQAQLSWRCPLLNRFHPLAIGPEDVYAVLSQVRYVEERVVDRTGDDLVRVRVEVRGDGNGEGSLVRDVGWD